MEIKGNLLSKISITEGTGARGAWVKGQFVLERDDEYRTKVAFITFSQDVIEQLKPLQPGACVTAVFNMESREYNGRWYTDLRCYRVDLTSKDAATNVPTGYPQPTRIMPEQPMGYDPLALDDETPF